MIDREGFENRYFEWLMEEAFATDTERGMYEGVCRVLFDIPFYWLIVLDENRAEDASIFRKFERHQLDQEKHVVEAWWLDQWENATPSVFEVLVGIAERWSAFFDDKTTQYFFSRHLFRNMGFHQFRGNLRRGDAESVRMHVDNWLSRQIEPNGDGSPFPINRNHVDMRTTDIWGQMNAYSFEHFQ